MEEEFDDPNAADGVDEAWAPVEDIENELHQLEQKWLLTENQNPVEKLTQIYRWDTPAYSAAEASVIFENASQTVCQLHAWMKASADAQGEQRVSKVIRAIQESYHFLTAASGWSGHPSAPAMLADDMVLRFTLGAVDKDSNIQLAYQFILSWCLRMELRHKDDVVYKQIVVRERKTHAWVPARDFGGTGEDIDTLEAMVSYICTKARNRDMWLKWIGINSKSIYDKLQSCREAEFPQLRTTRSWIAFRDGLYSVYNDVFLYYDDNRISFPSDLAVCAFHNINFGPAYLGVNRAGDEPIPNLTPVHPLVELETPLFDSIMNAQRLCGHTKFWLMALMGRCLFWDGVLDKWQIVLFIKGRAGTGKSTIINLLSSIYDIKDVAVISNNTEGTFGLMGLTPNKLLWVAPEVKTDFNLDQAQFQSLVSHEVCSVPRKNQKAWEGIIYAQGAMAGNTLPSRWMDNAASIRRRLFVIAYMFEVANTMTNLLERLKTEELAAIIRKIVWCYRMAVVLVGDKDIWKCGLLSPHILQQNEALYASTNPLRKLMMEGELRITPRQDDITPFDWCPQQEFLDLRATFYKSNNLAAAPWHEDLYAAVFSDYGISVRRAQYVWGDGILQTGTIIVGVCPTALISKMVTVEGMNNPTLMEQHVVETDNYVVDQERYDLD